MLATLLLSRAFHSPRLAQPAVFLPLLHNPSRSSERQGSVVLTAPGTQHPPGGSENGIQDSKKWRRPGLPWQETGSSCGEVSHMSLSLLHDQRFLARVPGLSTPHSRSQKAAQAAPSSAADAAPAPPRLFQIEGCPGLGHLQLPLWQVGPRPGLPGGEAPAPSAAAPARTELPGVMYICIT